MNKNILKIIISILMIFSCRIQKIIALSSSSISVNSSSNTVVVGNTIVVSIQLSSQNEIGSWKFCIGYDTSKLRLESSTLDSSQCMNAGVLSYSGQKSASYTMKFRAIGSGNASVYVNDATVYAGDFSEMTVSRGSKTFNIKTQAEIQASYSKNNYLSSLSVEGKELSPEFNKDTLEYSVELEPETTKININATVEDGKSSINGAGEREVTEGENNLEIIVTAENGSSRTYKIKATVKEHNPIKVNMGKEEYTVVRKRSQQTAPDNYIETTVKIGDEEVPAYKSEITKYTLVGLKDKDGNQNLYIYKDGKYTLYQEFVFNKVILYPISLETKDIPKGYKEVKMKYNDKEIKAYKIKASSKYALIYGMNIETGEENLYMYDSKEDTLQIYNDEYIKTLEQENDLYLKILLMVGSLLILLIGVVIYLLIKLRKQNKVKSMKVEV